MPKAKAIAFVDTVHNKISTTGGIEIVKILCPYITLSPKDKLDTLRLLEKWVISEMVKLQNE